MFISAWPWPPLLEHVRVAGIAITELPCTAGRQDGVSSALLNADMHSWCTELAHPVGRRVGVDGRRLRTKSALDLGGHALGRLQQGQRSGVRGRGAAGAASANGLSSQFQASAAQTAAPQACRCAHCYQSWWSAASSSLKGTAVRRATAREARVAAPAELACCLQHAPSALALLLP